MRKNFLYICSLLIVVFSFVSCYKDKGNYDYRELPTLAIDTVGSTMKPSMLVKQSGRLMLNPTVVYEGDKNNLAYKWSLYESAPTRPASGRYPSAIVVSEEAVLDVEMNYPAGKYSLTFAVTDKTTETSKYVTIAVEIESSISRGWVVLEDRDGNSDLSIIRTPLILTDLASADKGVQFSTFNTANGMPLGVGTFVTQYVFTSAVYTKMLVFNEGGGHKMNNTTLKSEATYSNFFYIPEETYKAEAFSASWNNSVFLVNNGDLQSGSIQLKFNGRIRGDYKAAPFLMPRKSGGPVMVIYDMKNKRFSPLPLFGTAIGVYPDATPGALFDMNNIGMDLVYMDNGYNDYGYAIFKDGSSNFHLYVANLNSSTQAPILKNSMSACPEIAKATAFAFGTRGEVCYYGAGEKVYFYDYSRTNAATSVLTFDSGDKVVALSMFRQTGHVNDGKLLIAATYNESTKAGKVHVLPVNEVTGAIETTGRETYTGFGKIKSMCNRQ